jgi:DNA-binding MarR family transcriptional regulator
MTTHSPTDEVSEAMVFYAALGLDVRYFSALWHTLNVGHILAIDLARVCRQHGLSIADFNLLGALRLAGSQALRPTDVATTMQVSHAALSARMTRLERDGLLVRSPAVDDRRASTLRLTPEGARVVDALHASVERESQFVRQYNRLSETERSELSRIMGKLHTQLDRAFGRAPR